jgi:hypothetical protein
MVVVSPLMATSVNGLLPYQRVQQWQNKATFNLIASITSVSFYSTYF